MGSVKGRMANNNPAIDIMGIDIMGIADMFLIGFVFSHGKAILLRLWERTAALLAIVLTNIEFYILFCVYLMFLINKFSYNN